MSGWEIVAAISSAICVWLLARNHPLGWWVGLVGIVAYAWIFYESKLYADAGLQAVYFVTSLQAIWIWLNGGANRTERPVRHLPRAFWLPTLAVAVLATVGLIELLAWMRGAAPLWDAITTVLSLVAHVYLMFRFVESWYLWVLVDTIYVPLYWSRGLYPTSAIYVVFWFLALQGAFTFRRLAREARPA